MTEKRRIDLPARRIKVELDVQVPYKTDFPKDFPRGDAGAADGPLVPQAYA